MSFFKSILKIIAIILIIIAIIYFIAYLYAYFAQTGVSSLGWLMLGHTTLSATMLLFLSFGALFLAALVDKDTTAKFIGKVGDTASVVVSSLGDVAGDLIGSGIKGLLSNPLVLGGVAIGAYLLLSGDE